MDPRVLVGAMTVESATAKPRSAVSVSITMRGHTLVQDKPATSDGRDEGPMASELLLAGLLACQHSTFVKIAAKRHAEATIDRLDGELHFDAAGDIERATVRFHLRTKGLDDANVETLLRLTEKACTVSKALKVPVASSYARL
jgi:uncharacterized OsmC-like protein